MSETDSGPPPTGGAGRGHARKASSMGSGGGGTMAAAAASSSGSVASASPSSGGLSSTFGAPLRFVSSPSLGGEMLRQALSAYLQTQVCAAHLAVVLFGFNTHEWREEDDIPLRDGRLVYLALTPSEFILVDKSNIGMLSSSVVLPSFDELAPPRTKKPGASVLHVPYYCVEEVLVDGEREDQFQAMLFDERTPGPGGTQLPTSLVISSVYRRTILEDMQALANTFFLHTALWSAGNISGLRAPPAHPYATREEARRATARGGWKRRNDARRKRRAEEGRDESSEDEEDLDDPPPLTGGFSVLTTSASAPTATAQVRTLRLTFEEPPVDDDEESTGGGGGADPPYRHPCEQFYQRAPSDLRGARVFHRAGYMWTMPAGWEEADPTVPRRSTGTYHWRDPSDEASDSSLAWLPPASRKHLLVHVSPERSMAPHSSLLRARDQRGVMPAREHGKATMREFARAREDAPDSEFFLWAENVARAIAMVEARKPSPFGPDPEESLAAALAGMVPPGSPPLAPQPLSPGLGAMSPPLGASPPMLGHMRTMSGAYSPTSLSPFASPLNSPLSPPSPSPLSQPNAVLSPLPDYFFAQSLVHPKRANLVGDRSSWVAFKVHVLLPRREVAILAARRRHLPPYLDTSQDLLFVLYGEEVAPDEPLTPDPSFMSQLERLLDSLCPTVVPLPWHYAQGRIDPVVTHPTYVDPTLLQARLNALAFGSESVRWIATRPWLAPFAQEHAAAAAASSSSSSSSRLSSHIGLVPSMRFLGASCAELGLAFANSILVRVSHREERVVWAERMPAMVMEGIGVEGAFYRSTPAVAAPQPDESDEKIDREGASSPAASSGSGRARLAAILPQGRPGAVDDPLDIVERLVTEFAAHEAQQRAAARRGEGSRAGAAGGKGVSGPTRGTYTAEEEWRARVAQYLYYVVDEGAFPGALTVKRLLNVITGALFRAPLISHETAHKLERVVDFLLYLRRRPGPPLDLPSLYSSDKAAALAAASSLGAKLGRPNPRHAQSIAGAFGSLAPTAPAASCVEGKGGSFEWDSSRSLLQKLRDPVLMSSFTCNESLMVHLLDANYLEYLENAAVGTAEQSGESVLPALLQQLLLKDYNLALVRAVCDKIIVNQIAFDGFIPTLTALARDGSVHAAIYALRALTFLARFFSKVMFDYGAVAVGMWHICMSKNEDLLDAAIDMVLELVTSENIYVFGQASFIKKLVDILRPRVGQQLRYRITLLQKTCSLILKFSQVPSLLSLFLSHCCHRELIDILSRGTLYEPILLHVSACMGQLYVNAGSGMLGAPSDSALHDASVLVRCVSTFTHREHLRLVLNLLIILQYLLRLPKAYYARLSNTRHNRVTGALQFTQPDTQFEKRMQILQHITNEENLEFVLEEVVRCATEEEDRTEEQLFASGSLVMIDGRKEVNVSGADERDDWLLGRRLVARNVKEKAKWFRTRINFSKSAEWNVRTVWQKDNAKQFLAIPKA